MTSEIDLRKTIPVFVNSFNQPTFVKDTVRWFLRNGFENVSVYDNASSSPQMLDMFERDPLFGHVRVVQLGENIGLRLTLLRVAETMGDDAPFIFTDPDLWLPDPPAPKFLTQLFRLAEMHKVLKVGLALDISTPEKFRDLQFKGNRGSTVSWEKKFWADPVAADVYRAPVDTTFFLYRPNDHVKERLRHYGDRQPRVPSVRVAGDGFVAKHRPWYIDDGQSAGERAFYLETTSQLSTWSFPQAK